MASREPKENWIGQINGQLSIRCTTCCTISKWWLPDAVLNAREAGSQVLSHEQEKGGSACPLIACCHHSIPVSCGKRYLRKTGWSTNNVVNAQVWDSVTSTVSHSRAYIYAKHVRPANVPRRKNIADWLFNATASEKSQINVLFLHLPHWQRNGETICVENLCATSLWWI